MLFRRISRILLASAGIVLAAGQVSAQTVANPEDWQNQQVIPPTQPAAVSLLDRLRQAPDPSAAISLYAEAARDPADAQAARSAFVQRMIEFGMPALAEQQARDIVAQDPNSGLAWAVLADAAGRRGETANAIKHAANAAKAAPADEFVQQTAGKLLAWFDTQAPSSQITNDMSSAASAIRTAMTGRSIEQDAYNQAVTFYREQERMAQQAQSQQQGTQQQGTQQQPSYTEDPYGRRQQSAAQQDQSYTEAPYDQQQQQTYTQQPYAQAQQAEQPDYNSYTYNTYYETPDYNSYGYSTPYALGYAPYYGYSYPYYGYYGYATPSYYYGGYEWPYYSTYIVAPYFWPRYGYYDHGYYGHGFFGHGYFPRYFTNYGSRYYGGHHDFDDRYGHYGYADRYGSRYGYGNRYGYGGGYGDRYGGRGGFGFTDSRYGYGNRYQVDRGFAGGVDRYTSARGTARDWTQSGIASGNSFSRGTFNRGTLDRGTGGASIPRSTFNRGTVDRSGIASGNIQRGSVTRSGTAQGGNFNNYGYVSPSTPRSSVSRSPGSTFSGGRTPQSINRSMGTSPRMSASRGITAPRSSGISRGFSSGPSRSFSAGPRISGRGSSPSMGRGGFSRGGGISRGGGGFARGGGGMSRGGGISRGGGGRGGGRR